MTSREIMTLARSGELLQLSPLIKDNDEIVLSFINMGMLEIYKRFALRTSEALITLVEGKTIYKLDGTDPDVSMSADEKFMYVITAYGQNVDGGDYLENTIELPINVEDNPYSINTISYNTLQIPLITAGSLVSIIYAAKPLKAGEVFSGQTSAPDPLDNELDLPDQFQEALLHYIGYRGHGAMEGDIQSDSNTHYMRFERSCDKIRELGVGITDDDVDMESRLNKRCFV